MASHSQSGKASEPTTPDNGLRSRSSASSLNTRRLRSHSVSETTASSSREETPPPLPPRRRDLSFTEPLRRPNSAGSGLRLSEPLTLSSRPTTAISRQHVQVTTPREPPVGEAHHQTSRLTAYPFGAGLGLSSSTSDDTASLRSSAPTLEHVGDVESLLGGAITEREGGALKPSDSATEHDSPTLDLFADDPVFDNEFENEFDELQELSPDGSNQG